MELGRPIEPGEAKARVDEVPGFVYDCINDAILRAYGNGRVVLKRESVQTLARDAANARGELFNEQWPEKAVAKYRKCGWNVSIDCLEYKLIVF